MLDSSISVQTSFFWRFVEHLGLSFERFTVLAVREFSPVSFLVSRWQMCCCCNFFICSLYLYCSLAPLLLLLLLSCSLRLLILPSHNPTFIVFVCACSTLQFIPCVSFLIPHHPLVSLLRCIEYSVEQHPRLLQHLHRRQDVGREEVQVRDYCCRRPRHHRRETFMHATLFCPYQHIV